MRRVTVETPLGSFSFHVDEERAPATSEHFLSVIRSGAFEDASVFRIVAAKNQGPEEANPIEVIQIGPRGCVESQHEHVPHESTAATGIRHRRGTVSAARVNLHQLFGSFFVCMRDEPALDHGASRHPDRQGFAAFGQVESGFETLDRIMEHAEQNDFLEREIPILSVAIESPDESGEH
mgnify:CR=1 FL=1